jgi:hypothetical protein
MTRPPLCPDGSLPRELIAGEIPLPLKEMLKSGLSLLWRGSEYARDLGADADEFAVKRHDLSSLGLSDIDLRWLLARGYVRIADRAVRSRNGEPDSDGDRQIRDNAEALVLTETGASLAIRVLSATFQMDSHTLSTNGHPETIATKSQSLTFETGPAKSKPSWDRDRKELRFHGSLVKQFRWSAINQETILMAFEEEAWPVRIDDPLPRKPNQDAKCRLHDAIKSLNRNHRTRLLRFSGDGTGEGVLWASLGAGVVGL